MARFEDHRAHVDSLVAAALAGADPAAAVARHLPQELHGKPLRVVGAGKASRGMLEGLRRCRCWIVGGVLVVPQGESVLREVPLPLLGLEEDELDAVEIGQPGPMQIFEADHPLPTERNVRAAQAVLEEARRWSRLAQTGKLDSALVVLLSGGASAHLTLPAPGLSVDDLRRVTRAMLEAGAPIEELNCVRKHCDLLKGGGLARAASPARVTALIMSDVIGDRLSSIGSGPTAPDPTTYQDALRALKRWHARDGSPAVTAHLQAGRRGEHPETAKSCWWRGNSLRHVTNRIIANNAMAVDAVKTRAGRVFPEVVDWGQPLRLEARHTGRRFAEGVMRMPRTTRARCVVAGGETTVVVRGQGRGGRNQELALAAAIAIDGVPGVVIASLATDGVDGPTDAAGAIVTGETCATARAMGIDPLQALAANDSHGFFTKVGGLIHTGPTGTNVNDIAVALVYPKQESGVTASPSEPARERPAHAQPDGAVVH